MTDAYLVAVLPVAGTGELIATIDFTNGSCWSSKRRGSKEKELAQKDLDKAIEKYKVNLIPDIRGNDDALSKEERAWVYECIEKKLDYAPTLVKSRIEKRRLTEIEMSDMLLKKEMI